MIDKETAGMINDMLHKALGKQSVLKQVARTARVTSVNTGMYYDLICSDNSATYSDIPVISPQFQYSVGDWVTFEYTGTDYIITGYSATSAGNG